MPSRRKRQPQSATQGAGRPASPQRISTTAWDGSSPSRACSERALGSDAPIDGVSLLFHGTAKTINIDWERGEYLTALPSGKTPRGADALYIGDLARKGIRELRVMSCHSGELSVRDNLAEVFHATQGVRTQGGSGALSYGYLSGRPRRSLWEMFAGIFVGFPKGWVVYGQAKE